MAGVRSSDQKVGIVPYTPVSNGASGGNSTSKNTKDSNSFYEGKKTNGLAVYDGNNKGNGCGSGDFTKGRNYAADPGNYGPSPQGSNFGPGGGTTRGNSFGDFTQLQNAPHRSQPGGTGSGYPVIDRAEDGGAYVAPSATRGSGFGDFTQNVRQRSQPGVTANGYPVINRAGDGGAYVTPPVPVSGWHGSEPTGPQPNGWVTTTNGPANHQLEGSGKTLNSGGGGGYGPHGYGGQNGSLSESEKHHHHHYYYTSNQHYPVPYNNNNTPQVQEKRRRRGAGALAAALIACWACTCCCHVPCGC